MANSSTTSLNYARSTLAELSNIIVPVDASSALPSSGVLAVESLRLTQHSRFIREGDDLVIKSGDGLSSGSVVIEGYFGSNPPPSLLAADGSIFTPAIVASFLEWSGGAEYGQKYVMGFLNRLFCDKDVEEAIAFVDSIEGLVKVTRDELVIELKKGASILVNDIISTGEDAKVVFSFTDDANFNLGENGLIKIDKAIYDEITSDGLQVLSVISGAFSYVSGLIVGKDPDSVKLNTPYGTIGIRGTKILGNVDREADELTVTVLSGHATLTQDGKEVAEISQPLETLRVTRDASGEQVFTVKTDTVEEVLDSYEFIENNEEQLAEIRAVAMLADAKEEAEAADGAAEEEPEPAETTVAKRELPTESVQIDGGEGDDSIFGGLSNDVLSGGAGNDKIEGNAGNDTINGGSGNDRIIGGAGNDALNGDEGDDRLDGGAGNDEYDFYVGDGNDVITDSSGVNELYFRSYSKVGKYESFTRENFVKVGDNLDISVTVGGVSQKITIENYYSSNSLFSIYYNTDDNGLYTQVSGELIPN